MSEPARRTRAARSLARLVVVAALLAGFAATLGMHCAEMGAGATMSAEHGSTSHTAELRPVDDAPTDGTGGLLLTCLAFFVTVVAATAALRPRWQRTSVAVQFSRPVVDRIVLRRGPALAELCVSRT